MSYRIFYLDPAAEKGYATGHVSDVVGPQVVNGQGRPFVQLEGRTGELYIAVSSIYKIEHAGEGETRLAVGSRS